MSSCIDQPAIRRGYTLNNLSRRREMLTFFPRKPAHGDLQFFWTESWPARRGSNPHPGTVLIGGEHAHCQAGTQQRYTR